MEHLASTESISDSGVQIKWDIQISGEKKPAQKVYPKWSYLIQL